MARRHGRSKSKTKSRKPRAIDPKDARIKRWNKESDIELDEEDQFHTARDKVLLEGEEYDDDDDGEEEVFGLKGLSDDDEDESGEEEENEGGSHSENEEEEELISSLKKAAKSKLKSKQKLTGPSKSAGSEEEGEESEEEETWGRSKAAYYSSNAAQLESDDEEANELEEQEARRLQAKARDAMLEEDFGIGDELEMDDDKIDVDTELLEEPQPTHPLVTQDKRSTIRQLERDNPEGLALARDWDDTAWNLVELQEKMARLDEKNTDPLILGVTHLHYQALLTYATTLAFYLYLRASEQYARHPEELRSHPVFTRILTLKQALRTLEELDLSGDENIGEDDDDEDGLDINTLIRLGRVHGLELNELEELLREASADLSDLPDMDTDAEDPGPPKSLVEPPKKKRKTSKSEKTPAPQPVFDLVEPEVPKMKPGRQMSLSAADATDAFGEMTHLHEADAADKQARKKSLRFHVSRIESTSARREGKRASAVGGDDDIPYKERRKEREARLAKEQERKEPLGMGGDDLDDVDPELEDGDTTAGRKRRRDNLEDEDGADDAEDADGYYELVKRQAKERKEKKRADYDAARDALRPNLDEEGISGPRSISRAIMANKGLTPHRSKSVRNPRVKKRQKYQKAQKKISSQKAVYKAGISQTGRYEGERSGITKVVKSIRLG